MGQNATMPARRRLAWLNAAGALTASFLAVAGLALQAAPGAEVVAVAFPPWWDAARVFSAAASSDAAVVRTTTFSSLLVVQPAPRDGLTRLRAAGAWLIMDPQAVAACFSEQSLLERS